MIEHKILGLISGSSLDGLDIAYCRFQFERLSKNNLELLSWGIDAADTLSYSEEWKDKLAKAIHLETIELLALNEAYGTYLGHQASRFIKKNQIAPDYIASHGHTIFHNPERGFTYQIGSGAALAVTSQLPVISGLRDQDMALGGQGAPIAPTADAWLFETGIHFFLNLGGIANLSCRTQNGFVAFDVTGCNQILNALAEQLGLEYDDGGKIAASGQILQPLLDQSMTLAFFNDPYPKSLDNQWVRAHQTTNFLSYPGTIPDKLRTACELIGIQIRKAIEQTESVRATKKTSYRLMATGGGALNQFLMDVIQKHCHPLNVLIETPSKEIINFKEAALIALMGALRIEKVPNVIASATGAEADSINGALFIA